MDNVRGVCTNCGVIVVQPHECNADKARLIEIDREVGPRALREILLSDGKKGYQNKIETLEAEAAMIRARL